MTRGLLLTVLGAALTHAAWGDEPAGAPKHDLCTALNNRVLGPRTADRPLPLLQGDPAHGWRPACAVPWSTLSPGNHVIAVTDCYNRNLLQLANDAACGRGTGPLWISSRWVVTSAELQQADTNSAICQKLETGAWAGTRDFPVNCRPQKKELKADSDAAPRDPAAAAAAEPSPAPATPAAPANPPAPTPVPGPPPR